MAQIDDGRLFWSPPLAVFDSIFAEFIELNEKLIHDDSRTAVSDIMGAAMCLIQEASKYTVEEKTRREDTRPLLNQLLGMEFIDSTNKDKTAADHSLLRHMQSHMMALALSEQKTFGAGNVITQGALSYRAFYLDPTVSDIFQNLLICSFANFVP